jgi:hypothetical protein
MVFYYGDDLQTARKTISSINFNHPYFLDFNNYSCDELLVGEDLAKSKWIVTFILAIFLGLAASGCDSMDRAQQPTEPTVLVDSTFKEFYQTLGGEPILGRPLTGLIDQNDKKCQYTEVALMCFDRAEPDVSHRFTLAPLGDQLDVQETPHQPPGPQWGSRDLGNGFVLYDEFANLYDRIYGALYTGRPLTQVRVNQALQRYEQFFENVGFYRKFGDPPGQAHLITYGAYLCGPDCSRNLNEYWQIIQSSTISQPFGVSVERLGWTDLGSPLTQPIETKDGMLEQVYDNVVLTAPVDDLSQVHFKPIVTELGVAKVEDPVAKNPHEQLVFYETANGLGHNVPIFFDHFIAMHGGMDLSGKPITEFVHHADGDFYRQCFENYCLDYLQNASQKVQMAPLGLKYASENEPGEILRRAFSPDTVVLKVDKSEPQLGPGEQQQLTLHVFQRDSNRPMYLVEGQVTLSLPDHTSKTYYFKPTDRTGSSTLTLPVLKGLPNMSGIEYQVCLNLPGNSKICQTDLFINQG